MEKPKTIIVMPGYNASSTLEKTILDIPFDYVDEVIFVDDASTDNTVAKLKDFCKKTAILTLDESEAIKDKSKRLLTIFEHKKNLGYGGNQKTCYKLALGRGADIVIMIHPDYQYDPRLSKYFVEYISDGYFDVMLGSRIRSRRETLAGGMPVYKYYANRFLSLIENIATQHNLSEWHTGMRAYKKEVLEKINFDRFSNDFIFDSQVLFAVIAEGYSIGDIPVPVRYFKEASSINFRRSARYGILTLCEVLKFIINNSKNSKIIRYVISGSVAVFVNLFTLFILVHFFQIWYLTSAVIAYSLGLATSYVLQKFFTFKESSAKEITIQLPVFVVFNLLTLGINTALMYLWVDVLGFWYILGQAGASLLIALINFTVFSRYIFRK